MKYTQDISLVVSWYEKAPLFVNSWLSFGCVGSRSHLMMRFYFALVDAGQKPGRPEGDR